MAGHPDASFTITEYVPATDGTIETDVAPLFDGPDHRYVNGA